MGIGNCDIGKGRITGILDIISIGDRFTNNQTCGFIGRFFKDDIRRTRIWNNGFIIRDRCIGAAIRRRSECRRICNRGRIINIVLRNFIGRREICSGAWRKACDTRWREG